MEFVVDSEKLTTIEEANEVIVETSEEKLDKKTKIENINDELDSLCSVCFDKLTTEDKPFECGHTIHFHCFLNSGKQECPMCRSNVKVNEGYKLLMDNIHRARMNDINEQTTIDMLNSEENEDEFTENVNAYQIEEDNIRLGNIFIPPPTVVNNDPFIIQGMRNQIKSNRVSFPKIRSFETKGVVKAQAQAQAQQEKLPSSNSYVNRNSVVNRPTIEERTPIYRTDNPHFNGRGVSSVKRMIF